MPRRDGRKVERDALEPEHFRNWIEWAKSRRIGMDFNPTFFAHPLGEERVHPRSRRRERSAGSGSTTESPAGASAPRSARPWALPVSRTSGFPMAPRTARSTAPGRDSGSPMRSTRSSPSRSIPHFNRDAVEGKLFGLGSESYVAGSHEFYFGYAVSRRKLLCLDAGHYHPTEVVSDKISAVLMYLDEILLHVSRGVRWDSDHVVILSDELLAIAQELVRGNYLGRVHIGLDFFDASINRVAAWVIGTRCMIKALLLAFLEPTEMLRRLEAEGDTTARLALLEELKTLPVGAVWDHYCRTQGVPAGADWLAEVKAYERDVLSKRG